MEAKNSLAFIRNKTENFRVEFRKNRNQDIFSLKRAMKEIDSNRLSNKFHIIPPNIEVLKKVYKFFVKNIKTCKIALNQ